jgi:uncharacterized membrane protein YciS (DUF1049 family)
MFIIIVLIIFLIYITLPSQNTNDVLILDTKKDYTIFELSSVTFGTSASVFLHRCIQGCVFVPAHQRAANNFTNVAKKTSNDTGDMYTLEDCDSQMLLLYNRKIQVMSLHGDLKIRVPAGYILPRTLFVSTYSGLIEQSISDTFRIVPVWFNDTVDVVSDFHLKNVKKAICD